MLEHLDQGQDLPRRVIVVDRAVAQVEGLARIEGRFGGRNAGVQAHGHGEALEGRAHFVDGAGRAVQPRVGRGLAGVVRSEEHTSELQSRMRSSYAVFCLKKKKNKNEGKTDSIKREQRYAKTT